MGGVVDKGPPCPVRMYRHRWGDHSTEYVNALWGFCKVNVYEEPSRTVAELYDLVVYPECRGLGHGRELLGIALDVARGHGACALVLWPDCEPWVVRWYARLGFAPDPSFRDRDGVPGMALRL